MNNHSPSPFFDEGIKLISFCPVCRSQKHRMEAQVIEENEVAHLVHLHCPICKAAVLAMLTFSPAGLNSIGMVTDLSAEEAARFKDAVPFSADDAINLHQFLGQPDVSSQLA